MLIFLYGQDTYRSRQKLKEIIESYQKSRKSGLSLRFFEGKNTNFSELKDEFQQVSMFKEKKLFVLEGIFKNSFFGENFLKNAKDFKDSEDIVIFCEKEEIDKGDALFKFLKKEAKCQEFNLLEGVQLKNWIKKEFENYRFQIESSALEVLILYIGNDLWQLSNETRKLVSYKGGPVSAESGTTKGKPSFAEATEGKGEIELKDIQLLVKPQRIEVDIFKTIDALAVKNKKTALSLIRRHLEKGDPPLYLLSMITFQFRNLLLIKSLIDEGKPYYTLAKITKLHPFVVKKSYFQAQKFSFEELKKIYQKIFKIDFDIKTGKMEPEAALDIFIAEI